MRALLRKPWVLVGLSSLVLLAALAVCVALMVQADAREARALRTKGAIIGVTHGSEPLVVGATWQKVLLRFFPHLQAKIGGAVLRANGIKPGSLVIWMNAGKVGGWSGPPPTMGMKLVGDRGESMRESSFSMDWPDLGDTTLMPFEVRCFPRRGRRVRIHFEEPWFFGQKPPDLIVPNPVPGDYPTWVPEALPVRKQVGDLELLLERFDTGFSTKVDGYTMGPQTRLTVRLRELGTPAAGWWDVEKVALRDATGNRWEKGESSRTLSGERARVEIYPQLLPDESAYRVQVELARTDRFPPGEVGTFTGLRIPAAGKVVRISRRVKLQGCTLEITHLLGSGAVTDLGWVGGNPTAAVRVSGPREKYCLRAQTSGFSRLAATTTFEAAGGGTFCVDLASEKQRGTVTLKLALTPRRTVEWLAHATRPAGR